MEPAALRRLVLRRFLAAAVGVCLLLFLPAGTLRYGQAWAYLALLFSLAACVFRYFLKHDPEVIERRMRMKEKVPGQRRLVRRWLVVFLATLVVPALDRRFGWSSVPWPLSVAADAVIALAYLLFFRVLKENRYASRIVEVERGQTVVTTGPYALVRHPMYVAVSVIYVLTPLALGSFWGLLAGALIPVVLVARIRSEEELLLAELEGYREYAQRTRYRLIPGIW